MTREELRRARLDVYGMTQSDAANLVNVSTRTWQRWEGGQTEINQGLAELYVLKANISKHNGGFYSYRKS